MRKLILIAGFVLASTAAQAGDRSLSLGGIERAPAKAVDAPKTAEVPQPPEPPKYVERPAIEPKAETPKAETAKAETPKAEAPKPAAKVQQPAAERSRAERGRPVARRTAFMSRSMKPRRRHHWIEARIVRELHRHGIYW
ncbi:type IV secretory pathway VirB10-like protein [Bradyrhizobium sp. AZCC 1588]